MPTIRDRQLSSLYTQLESQRRSNPSLTIDDAQVTKLLAAVADGNRLSGSQALAELSKPGVTRAQQVELIRANMTNSEKADLATILDNGTVPLSPSARNFVEAVLERAPVKPGNPLQIVVTGDQRNGISGVAGANVTIEAINLSTAPGQRLRNEDTMVIGQTDSTGKFTGRMPDMQQGDVIRMRARDANGNVGEWVEVKANVGTRDTRGAVLAVFRLGLTDLGNGKIAVANINGSRQISEPGAKVQFTNVRTGEKSVVTIDNQGQLPKDLQLNGRPGDQFDVSATDGVNNTAFTVSAGTVAVPGGSSTSTTIDLPDPALHKDELDANGKPRFSLKRFSGPLFKNGVNPEDVQQGQIGNCYMPAAFASMAKSNPEALTNMIKDNKDGTYTVTFKERDWRNGGRYKDVEIKVDGDLYVRSYGGPLYGATNGPDKGTTTMELWYPLIEKAYAQWKGSYDSIGNGGLANDCMEAVLGRAPVNRSVKYASPDQLWRDITSAIDQKRPAAAGTYGESQKALYTNTGVFPNHAYSILGYEEKDGQRMLIIRNPWGESEPAGNGANDGIFKMKLDEFMKLYQTFMTVQ
ncbi:MAG: C2 family cysteine protease [Myxococcales bacterium]